MKLQSNKENLTVEDKLPYFSFDTETDAIWLKDGSATLSLKIVPKACANMTDEELDSLRHALTPILGQLPEGCVLQALLLRDRSKAGTDEAYQRWLRTHQSDDDSGAIASKARQLLLDSRKKLLEQDFVNGGIFQTRCYLTLRVPPDGKPKPGKSLGPFSHFAFAISGKGQSHSRREILNELEAGLESLRTGLTSIGFDVLNVTHEERMQVIYEWLNPERSRSVPAPPYMESASISEQVALTDLIENHDGLSLGRTRLNAVTLKSLPEVSIPAMLGGLSSAPTPYSLILTVYVLPQTAERERLLRKQRLAQGMASGNSVRNLMAEAQLKDIEDTIQALISSGEKLLAISYQMVGHRGGIR